MHPKPPPRRRSGHVARLALVVLLLTLDWHRIVPLGLALAVTLALGLTATHLHAVLTIAAVWLLARTLHGIRRTLAARRAGLAARIRDGGAR